jgi:hypothetical protein
MMNRIKRGHRRIVVTRFNVGSELVQYPRVIGLKVFSSPRSIRVKNAQRVGKGLYVFLEVVDLFRREILTSLRGIFPAAY